MKLNRKNFLGACLGLVAAPWSLARGTVTPPPPPSPPLDPWLAEWLRWPRVPVWDKEDPCATPFIEAAQRGEPVEFYYLAGRTPGARRRMSPGMVFRLQDGAGPLYVSGFCHERQQERVFRLDRLSLEPPDVEVKKPEPPLICLAAGLSDEDVLALMRLVRAHTTEPILHLRSEGEDAAVTTGVQADGLCGAGTSFEFVRADGGWRLRHVSEWIS